MGGADHELALNVHPLGAGFTGPDCGTAVNHARTSYAPSRYTMECGCPPHPATVSCRLLVYLCSPLVDSGFFDGEGVHRISESK